MTNAPANKINYTIEKIWLDKDGNNVTDSKEPTDLTFYLYRSINGSPISEASIGRVTMDGRADAQSTELELQTAPGETETVSVQEKEPWILTVEGLEEFDSEGRQWEYAVLENPPAGYFPAYVTTRDALTGDYETKVTNASGEGSWILVSKQWIDDSDTLHREPVTVQVYDKETNKPLENAGAVLSDANTWSQWVSIGEYEPDEVYLLETKMGSTEVPGHDPAEPFRFDAEHHTYEVTYELKKIADSPYYNLQVTNRRLGWIDLTVTKNWVDQEGVREALQKALEGIAEDERPALYMQLELSEHSAEDGRTITRNRFVSPDKDGDTVTLVNESLPILDKDNDPVYSQQELKLDGGDAQELYFWNLPKYDSNGVSVEYTVREVWRDPSGEEISTADMQDKYPELYGLWMTFGSSKSSDYQVNHDQKEHDKQSVDVTNRLTGTKSVMWHKQWKDQYVFESGRRPDIFLDVYAVKQTKADGTKEAVLQSIDYRWTNSGDDEQGDSYAENRHWHVVLDNMPKYDSYGNEVY